MRGARSNGERMRRLIVAVIGLGAAATLLSGCVGGDSTPSSSASSIPTATAGSGRSASPSAGASVSVAYACGQFSVLQKSVVAMNGLVTAGVIVETDVDVMLPFVGTTFTDLAAVTGVEPAPAAIRAVGDYGQRATAWSAFRTTEWTTLAGAAESACTGAGVIPAL